MEDVKARPCRAAAGVEAFYWRAGVLLGLAYLARGVDFHRENMIAAGEYPVLIDLEALMHPQKPGGGGAARAPSVLSTGFLPQGNPESALYNWSALSRQIRSGRERETWVRINQDDMALETGRRDFQDQDHLPSVAGAVCLAPGYVSSIQTGFLWLGEWVLETDFGRREFDHWLQRLRKAPRRLILGLTVNYQRSLARLVEPSFLRSEHADARLALGFTQTGLATREVELKALVQFDIPYFEQGIDDEISSQNPIGCEVTSEQYLAQNSVIAEALQCTGD